MRLTMEGPALPCRSRSSSMVVKMSNLFQMPGSCSDVKLRYLARRYGMVRGFDSCRMRLDRRQFHPDCFNRSLTRHGLHLNLTASLIINSFYGRVLGAIDRCSTVCNNNNNNNDAMGSVCDRMRWVPAVEERPVLPYCSPASSNGVPGRLTPRRQNGKVP